MAFFGEHAGAGERLVEQWMKGRWPARSAAEATDRRDRPSFPGNRADGLSLGQQQNIAPAAAP
ncbi:hypothetical protein [Neolewinella agarilytica]|uniref:hypothetical protein n=1 Tax=Neolewinella agarilytica TaxID=478744 RepID=UPI000B7D5C35|nr:hypothetical protein [Neolewinella agarilytica]